MSNARFSATWRTLAMLMVVLMETACGGGGYGSAGYAGGGSISGAATKGPLGGATVTAYAIANGQMGAQIGSAMTDGSGNYTMSVSSYSGPVMLRVSGGSYTDEATGVLVTMGANDVMTAVMPSMLYGTTLSGIQITPITSMAQALAQQMAGGMTDANINAANTRLGNYFSVNDILHVQPMNPLMSGAKTGACQDACNYGVALAAMSQYAHSLGMTNGSALVTAMMNDASDGVMDGRRGSAGQISMSMGTMMGGMMSPPTSMMASSAGTTGLATAMQNFITNTTANAAGVSATDVAALMQKLMTSNGTL